MPPEGGFPAIKYKRNLPFRGPSGVVILGAVTAICAFGFYRVAQGNLERRCANMFAYKSGLRAHIAAAVGV